MNTINESSERNYANGEEGSPSIIREGVFGATFCKNNETFFLRMELLTPQNTENWDRYKEMAKWVTMPSRGVLSCLVGLAGKPCCPTYEEIKEVTGFTNEEYLSFIQKAIDVKNKTNTEKAINVNSGTTQSIVDLLKANSNGNHCMYTGFDPVGQCYIVYASKNPNFSIEKIQLTNKTLKNFIESYHDILISVGSNFSEKESFTNRGIFRNPYWVFEEKYAGLSMLLHGFSGAVANKYFPNKNFMHVNPLGSMQVLIKKALLPEEGYLEKGGEKIDLTTLNVNVMSAEQPRNHIKISALVRIYNETIKRLSI